MTKKTDKIKIIPLGGLGAIGKNITLFEYKNEIIIVDCGIQFPDEDTPGIDFIIPDFSYIRKHKSKIKAIIITHGHEDHIGAIPFLLNEVNVPIYATGLTIGLIQSRLIERPPKEKPQFIEVKPRDVRKIGNFSIEFINVNHSIIGGVALAIKTEVGTIIHTGDFKIDFSPVDGEPTDLQRFSQYGEDGVLLLMSDSTNAERDGFSKSESIIINKMIDIFSNAKGRIIVATFASNIHRIQQVLDVAQRFNKKVVISGLSMQKNIEISSSLGYLDIKKDLIVNVQQANALPSKKLVIISTGSQGEPMSALSRIANGTHRHFTAEKGDMVIVTASIIPGNEKMINSVVNALMKEGAEVFYDKEEAIHVSGHGSSKELKLMLSMTKPKFFFPVHGEYKHLKAHTKIAESLNMKPSQITIAENGDILELTKNNFRIGSKLSLSKIFVDGSLISDTEHDIIKERQTISNYGIVIVTILLKDKSIYKKAEISTRGFIGIDENDLTFSLQHQIEQKLKNLLKSKITIEEMENRLEKSIQQLIYKNTQRNPLITISFIELDK